MTSDRKKAALYLIITLIIGILIGSLIPAFFGRMRHGNKNKKEMMMKGRENRMERKDSTKTKREWLTYKIIQIVKPDSDQVKSIRPITMKAAAQIGALEKESNGRMIMIMDSLKLNLKPILTAEQNQKLEDFSSRARKRWRR